MPETLLSEDRQRWPNTVQNLCAEAGIKKWLPSSFNLSDELNRHSFIAGPT
jgi:hypothetical protein